MTWRFGQHMGSNGLLPIASQCPLMPESITWRKREVSMKWGFLCGNVAEGEARHLLSPHERPWLCRSRKRWILPVWVFGSASINFTERGYLNGAMVALT